MGEKATLVLDPATRESIPIELPLAYRTAPEEARRRLGVGEFVDLTDPVVARAVAFLLALRHEEPPVRLACFGGTAFRLLCPSSNDPALGLRHPLHDLDLACLQKEIRRVRAGLVRASEWGGSALTCFETRADFRLNTLLGGRRFRYHMVETVGDGGVGLVILDLVADEFRFCHAFDLVEDLSRPGPLPVALSPTLLFLTKMQFVQRVPARLGDSLPERVIAPFGTDEILIGPEAKDVRDVLALLLDFDAGEDPGAISLPRIASVVGNDWGAWSTLRLNVGNLLRSPILAGLPPERRTLVAERIRRIKTRIDALAPKRRLGLFRKEWWDTVDTADDRVIPAG